VQRVQRTCPACGHTEETAFEHCSRCGASFFARPARSRWPLVVAAVLLLLASGAGVAVVLDRKAERDAREAALDAAAVEREKARLRRVQAPKRGAARELREPDGPAAERLAARAALVEAVEASITADARARVEAGELQGVIERTDCGPVEKRPDAVTDDRKLDVPVGRFDCVAVQEPVINGEGERVADFGFAFVAAVDFGKGTYVWCRNNPPQGERGISVYVRLDRACLAAKGRALGTGYVDDR
jgi:hypothetical protein